MADGTVIIRAEADTKRAQSELAKLERELQKAATAMEKTGSQKNVIADQLEAARQKVEETTAYIQELKAQLAQAKLDLSGQGGQLDYYGFIAAKQVRDEVTLELKEQEKLLQQQQKEAENLEKKDADITAKLKEQTAEYERQQEKVGSLRANLMQAGNQGMRRVKEEAKGSALSLKSGLATVAKYVAAFFSLRKLISYIKQGFSDFAARDSETQTNVNALKASLNGLKSAWGAAFAPVLNAVTPILQTLIKWLTDAANAVNAFFSALSGRGTYKKVVSGMNAIEKSAGGAGGAAEEAKKQIMGFDEINRLDDNKSGGGGGGGGSNPLSQFEEAPIDGIFKKFADKIRELKESLDFEPLRKSWERLKESLKGFANLVEDRIGFVWDTYLVPLAHWTIEEILPLVIENLAVALDLVRAVLEKLMPYIERFEEEFLVPFMEWDKDRVVSGLEGLRDVLQKITDLINGDISWKEFFNGLDLSAEKILNWMNPLQLVAHEAGEFFGGELKVLIDQTVFDLTNGFEEIKTSALNTWENIKTSAVRKFDEISRKLHEWWDRLRQWWDGLSLGAFHIPVPHFEWTYSEASGIIARALEFVGLPATIPHLNISWFAKGGIVNGATLFGAGEAGKEAIIPLERNTGWIKKVAEELLDTMESKFSGALSGMPAMAMGGIAPPRALNSSGSMFSDGDIERLVSGIAAAFGMGGGDNVTKLYLDGRQIAEAVTKHQNNMSRGTGR